MNNEYHTITLVLGHFKALQSNEKLYDNIKEDLSTSVLYSSFNKENALKEFKRIVKQEKEKSWVADYSTFNLPEYITHFEDDTEYYFENTKTKEFTHIQVVNSLLTNTE